MLFLALDAIAISSLLSLVVPGVRMPALLCMIGCTFAILWWLPRFQVPDIVSLYLISVTVILSFMGTWANGGIYALWLCHAAIISIKLPLFFDVVRTALLAYTWAMHVVPLLLFAPPVRWS